LFLSHRFIPGERITLGKLWGILLGFGGVAAMFAGGQTFSGSIHTGDFLVLAAVTVWSGNVVLIATGILLVHRSPKWPTFTFPLGRGW